MHSSYYSPRCCEDNQPHLNAAKLKEPAWTFRRKPPRVSDIKAQQTYGGSPVSLIEDG